METMLKRIMKDKITFPLCLSIKSKIAIAIYNILCISTYKISCIIILLYVHNYV